MIWNIDPVAFEIFGWPVRWYGIIYLVGFFIVQHFGWRILSQNSNHPLTRPQWEDACFYTFLFGIIGGRLGEFLFYSPRTFWTHPIEIIKIWQGGLSMHGGFLGALIALYFWSQKQKRSVITIFDALVVPLSAVIGLGRIANFINGEIVGIPTNTNWGVVFPHVDELLRHPVQLYESASMFLLCSILYGFWKYIPLKKGTLTQAFLVGYGVFRFVVEFWKESPGYIAGFKTGQVLCFIMILVGLVWKIVDQKTNGK